MRQLLRRRTISEFSSRSFNRGGQSRAYPSSGRSAGIIRTANTNEGKNQFNESGFIFSLRDAAILLGTTATLAYTQFHNSSPLVLAEPEHSAPAPSSSTYAAPPSTLPPEFFNALSVALRRDQVVTCMDERTLRGKPYNSYHKIDSVADVVVFPETTADISTVVRLCHKYGVPIVCFGGGTSLEGQTLSPKRGLSLDFSHMKKIISFNPKDLDITVQPGLGYIELNDFLRPYGLWFPLDPGPGASIGGMCACRCSGSTALRYGSMRENVLSMVAVLPDRDGTIFKTGGRARKSSAGYDLTRLLIGSEGTLAVISEVTLKLHHLPKFKRSFKISFPSLEAAALTASLTLSSGVTVARCELVDELMIDVINSANPTLSPRWDSKPSLLFEVTGHCEEDVIQQANLVYANAQKQGADSVIFYEDQTSLWRIRKEALWSIMATYPDREPLITDACVPLSKLPEIMTLTRKELDKSPLPCPMLAHAGDGNFHVIVMFKPDDPAEVAEAKKLAHDMAALAISMGGTCTGEHGIGVGKMDLLREEMGPGSMHVMETIKDSLDKENILNPGKVVIGGKSGLCT